MCQPNQDFIHLHLHTEYSLLDGFARIDKVIEYAKRLKMPALGITDHGTMFGVIDFYKACKAAEIKPIIGVEAYLAPRRMTDRDSNLDTKPYHMLLLAHNPIGYKNLLKLSSEAQLNGYYYRPRIDKELMAQYAEGIIATSGCLAAEIPRMVEQGREEEAKKLIGWYQDVFGKENFFLELQAHDIPELYTLNRWLIENMGYANAPLLATNDVHYVRKQDYVPHDTLLCIQTSSTINDSNRLKMTDNSYYLRTQAEMWALFGDYPESLCNSLLIAERCQDLDLTRQEYHLPVFPVPSQFEDAGAYLRYLCEQGVYWRFGNYPNQKVWDRLNHELNIIHTMGFDTYFLIVWDLTQFASSADIWWNVRGSGAGSLVAYTLGITSLDPLENGLLFERFLNPGRVSMPDMDLDFPEDRRSEMIAYCCRKYGEDKVAAIITFGTLGAKAAIRDVARVYNIPLTQVEQIVRTIPTSPALPPLPDLLGDDPEKAIPDLKQVYTSDPSAKHIIDLAIEVEGVPRHASTHAAGIIVADKPLVEYIPLHRPTKGDSDDSPVKMVTQFPMETAESIGLLKVDFLGLSTLTILRKACELIKHNHGIDLDMSNIPYKPHPNDPLVTEMVAEMFEMIGRGETIGVFQVESSGMRQMLTEMRPKTFEHIIAAISLYRPGPMDYIPTYNKRMHGEEEVIYHHEKLIPILGNTYGICISGESLILDARTGKRLRVDEIGQHEGVLPIQGVDEDNLPALGRVTHLIYTGKKEVYRITLKNGASIKATADHQFLTEAGWQRLGDLQPGDYVGTPHALVEPHKPTSIERDKLRVLAYLIADGNLANGASVDFVTKEPVLVDEFVRSLGVFKNLEVSVSIPLYDTTVSTQNRGGQGTSSLLTWLRKLELKFPAVEMRWQGGCHHHEKFIPEFVFKLSNDDLGFFLASLWDCKGFMGERVCHYETPSYQLAGNIQMLLLRLGITSAIHQAPKPTGKHPVYQITTYDTARLSEVLAPHMVSVKKVIVGTGKSQPTIDRDAFIAELEQGAGLSKTDLMERYNINRQHLYSSSPRIAAQVVKALASELQLPHTLAATNIIWEEVKAIEPAGVEEVYDLTVEGTHNFIANQFIVHNCVYQEQIMQIGAELFGYSLGEADLMRRAVSKKKEKDLMQHRATFIERGPENGIDEEAANKIFDDIAFFARYGFNKCVVGSTEIIDAETGQRIKIEDLATGKASVKSTFSLDTASLRIITAPITAAMENGIKPVYRLTTQTGRSIEATANHPFFTPQGWRLLGELRHNDLLAIPYTPTSLTSTPGLEKTYQVENDVLWDRVVIIDYTGEQLTYDLTIEGTHNFIANDIIVHNSHAADYAVITCQTAFLKCHYPHEYMTALMSVYYDDSDKVSIFIADCRRMGIDVLPPNINRSQADFHIETDDSGKHIRFGFGAIKNVGMSTVDYIIQQRAETPFTDFDDFLKRCNMKDVGKRALESLIKVGAFDCFSLDRAHLLANLEHLMTFSTDYHKNAAVGQVNMFDMLGSEAAEVGSVFSVMKETPDTAWDRREQLRWEKDLIGLYVSEHPLTRLWSQLKETNLYTTGDLKEDIDTTKGKKVRILGLVTNIRQITTKKGDAMGILTVEDIQGSLEAVLFPRTWQTYVKSETATTKVEMDKIYIFEGKADLRGTDIQIIVESITQNFDISTAQDEIPLLVNKPDHDFDEETGEVVKARQEAPVPPPLPAAINFVEAIASKQLGEAYQKKSDLEEPAYVREAFEQGLPDQAGFDDNLLMSSLPYTDDGGFSPLGVGNIKLLDHFARKNYERLTTPRIEEYPETEPPRVLVIEIERSYQDASDRRTLRQIVGLAIQNSGRHEFWIVFKGADGTRKKIIFDKQKIKITRELIETLKKIKGVLAVYVDAL